jgi:glyceraldehyde-3-phosphate dehydrogenase/erythrose-4-phosphate dehydrogenase
MIVVGRHKMKATAIKDPTLLPHKELGVDIVMECTGIFEAAQEGGTLDASDRSHASNLTGQDRIEYRETAKKMDSRRSSRSRLPG